MRSPITTNMAEHDSKSTQSHAFQHHSKQETQVRITADFSKETNDRRKAFLSLIPRLRQLDVKYGLFNPARITKGRTSRDFYEPEDLRLFLDTLSPRVMDTTPMTQLSGQTVGARGTPPPIATLEVEPRHDNDLHLRGRDPERLASDHERDHILQVVAHHTQLSDRDKSRCSLKLFPAST
ncbi:hypothetical protein NDU88_000898 [Pleurodeles waltl]|uniref:Uncharacterized protein n=1 Tax=Pleurodeles waltl TaxID=8319 RepID=A0AAV7UVE2_PLEWA|nr:hypothetical protein NDU88_000898 [Pleurodeles waltl]